MAFLQINGHDIPIADCQEEQVEVGSRSLSYSGQQQLQRRNILRQWTGDTNQIKESEAVPLIGEIQGTGHAIPMSDASPAKNASPFTDGVADGDQLYSHGGLGAANDECDHLLGVAADGRASYDESDVSDKKYYDLGVMCAPAATNLLPADERDAEGTPSSDYTAVGTIIGESTSIYYRGTKSVSVLATPTGYLETSYVACAAGSVTGSVMLYADSTATGIRIVLWGSVSGSLAASSRTLTGGGWHLYTVTATCAAENVKIQVQSTLGTHTLYCDDFQVENTAYRTPWVDGTRSSAGDLEYPVAFSQRVQGYTLACWAKSGASVGSAYSGGVLLQLTDDAGAELVRLIRSSNNLIIESDGGTSATAAATTPWSDNAWHHICGVFDPFGEGEIRIYVDGVSQGSASISGDEIPEIEGLSKLHVGNNSGSATGQHYGQISDVVLLPYAAPAAQVAAIAGMGKAMSPLPEYYVDGDGVMGPALTVKAMGEVRSAKFVDGAVDSDTGYQVNLREISMRIREQPK